MRRLRKRGKKKKKKRRGAGGLIGKRRKKRRRLRWQRKRRRRGSLRGASSFMSPRGSLVFTTRTPSECRHRVSRFFIYCCLFYRSIFGRSIQSDLALLESTN